MTLLEFANDLEEVLELSRMDPASREYRKAVKALLKGIPVDADLMDYPGKRRWEYIYLASTLISVAYIIAVFAAIVRYSRTLDGPVSNAGFWLIMGGLAISFVLLAPAGYAGVQMDRLRHRHIREKIDLLAGRLQALTQEQFERIDALLHNIPDFYFSEECTPVTPCGCYRCVLTFEADVRETDYMDPVCPRCGCNDRIVYGGEGFPVTVQDLQILHDLFIEEQ